MLKCSKEAFAACPTRHLCGCPEEAVFTEGSECDKFNRQIGSQRRRTEMAPEQRLIDAIAAADGIIDQLVNEWGYDGIREDVQRIFNSTPTVDAVEVVRCRDCKHYMTIHCTCDGCCISDDWYCADGERRTDP